MRWRSILESIYKEAELCHCLFLCESKNLKHFGLQLSVVYSYRTAAKFYTVAYKVVCQCANLFRMSLKQGDIVWIRHCERVVYRHQSLFFIAPFKQWEVYNP